MNKERMRSQHNRIRKEKLNKYKKNKRHRTIDKRPRHPVDISIDNAVTAFLATLVCKNIR